MRIDNGKVSLPKLNRFIQRELDKELRSDASILKANHFSISDQLFELNRGIGNNSNPNDIGFIFQRGSSGNDAFFIWSRN